MSKTIVNIPIYNCIDTPLNKSCNNGRALISLQDKLELIKTTINNYAAYTNTSDYDICFTMQYNDSPELLSFLQSTGFLIIDAPEALWPGPFAAREAVWRYCPGYDYYFTTDIDTTVIRNNWIDTLINCITSNPQIGLIGGRKSFGSICPSFVKDVYWKDINGNIVDPHNIAVDYVTDWSFFPSHVLELFDKHWGHQWVPLEKDYYTSAGIFGELYFSYKVKQLGLECADLMDYCDSKSYNITPDMWNGIKIIPNFYPFINTYMLMHALINNEYFIKTPFYNNSNSRSNLNA